MWRNYGIHKIKNGKSPGPDRFGNEFYKKFRDLLVPHLNKMFGQAFDNGELPHILNEAIITLLPKTMKDLEEVGSYRPICLLNTDQKILTKTLAKTVSLLIGKLVHPDQSGFIPQRYSYFNLWRLFNVMYSSQHSKEDLLVLSLDAEKAFDQVEWTYFFAVLNKFEIGNRLWIKLLYNNPCARILTSHTLSPNFKLHQGTRQGCTFSPLLFILAIETLAEKIQSNPEIYGYNTKYTVNKIYLHADDILLFISRPQTSIPSILSLINLFESFAGYRVNWDKSELMPIQAIDHETLNQFPFSITREKFKYLGIIITRNYNSSFKANFDPLMDTLRNNIQFWRMLPISLLGRTNAIKMIFLPQLLYLLQNIPVCIYKTFFKHLDSIILSFVWDYKIHRIGKAHLCNPKTSWGLALPNFIH